MYSLKYRPDIDGLRAIAVVSVVLFHAFPTLAPGGYVGVDVFFVISGFLITSLILAKLNDEAFSFIDFYARRIKRIFPALILVLSCCLALGWLDMLPNEFRLLGSYVQAAAGFWINIALWRDAGYFDPAGIQKPLLHLWSLAIEEQFYLLWPCLILLVWKLGKRHVFSVVIGITFVSLGANLLLIGLKPVPTFYLLPTRAWELLSGAGLIWIAPFLQATMLRPGRFNRVIAEVPTVVGLFVVVGSIAFLDANAPFPGWRAIPPVLGTMLMLCMGPSPIVNRLLSHPGPVAIGLISYPLYLWHWPALSFPHIVGTDTAAVKAISILVALALSAATYLFVERGIRSAAHSSSLVLIAFMALVGGIGALAKYRVVGSASDTLEVHEIFAAIDEYAYPANVAQPVPFEDQTFWREGSGAESVIFWGDSNAEMYFTRARKVARQTGKSVIFAIRGGCPPILGSNQTNCEDLEQSAFRFAKTSPATTVVLAAWWTSYLSGIPAERSSKMYASIGRVISDLRAKGKRVFLILNIPTGQEFSPEGAAIRHLFGIELRLPVPVPATINAQYKPISDMLMQVAGDTGALVIDPFQYLCKNGLCLTLDSWGHFAYRDRAHLSSKFVEENATFIDRVFQ